MYKLEVHCPPFKEDEILLDEHGDVCNNRLLIDSSLSARAKHKLLRKDISTIGQLWNCPMRVLINEVGIGVDTITMKEIQDLLKSIHLLSEAHRPATNESQTCFIVMFDTHSVPVDDKKVTELPVKPSIQRVLHKMGFSYLSEMVMNGPENVRSEATKGISHQTIQEIDEYCSNYFLLNITVPEPIVMLAKKMRQLYGGSLITWNTALYRLIRSNKETDAERLNALFHQGESGKTLLQNLVCDVLSRLSNETTLNLLRANIPESIISEENLRNAIQALIKEDQVLVSGDHIELKCPRFREYVQTLKNDRQRDAVTRWLDGETCVSIGQFYGVTKERIRQIIYEAIHERPHVWEDRYIYIVKHYDFRAEKTFRQTMDETQETARFLSVAVDDYGTRPPEKAADDPMVPQSIRDKILQNIYVLIDGARVPRSRAGVLQYYIKNYCSDSVRLDEFWERYQEFVHRHDLAEDDDLVYSSIGTVRDGAIYRDAFDIVLCSSGYTLRYYDFSAVDEAAFFGCLNLAGCWNTEISTRIIYDQNLILMKEYDIRDKNELHNFLRKLKTTEDHSITMKKMPIVVVGKGSRETQVRELMEEYQPISAAELARRYSERYGVDAYQVRMNYFGPIKQYCRNGIFQIGLSSEDISDDLSPLKNALTKDFYFKEEFQAVCEKTVPARRGKLTTETINYLGYDYYVQGETFLIHRKYKNSRSYFSALLQSGKIIDTSKDYRRLEAVPQFRAVVSELLQKRIIMEYDHRKYISASALEEKGITPQDIDQFCEDVKNFTQAGELFTLEKVLYKGFSSPLLEKDFPLEFYAGLLRTDASRFTYCRTGHTYLIRNGTLKPSIELLIKQIVKDHNGKIYTEELDQQLKSIYGIALQDRLITAITHAKGVQYNRTTRIITLLPESEYAIKED